MAIKYEVKTGSKHLNEIAKNRLEHSKLKLKGMRCGKCSSNTLISYVPDPDIDVKMKIEACCPEFENRIREKMWPNKKS